MAKFDAGNVVESLDFDFTKLARGDDPIEGLANSKGTIREPTPLQVQEYANACQRQAARQRRDVGTVDPKDADAVLAAVDKMTPEKTEAEQRVSAEIISTLCSGNPSVAELMLLPHRAMNAFGDWIAKEVLDPEVLTGGGKAHLRSLKSSSAG